MALSNTSKLFITLALLIAFIYIRFYLSTVPHTKIVQLSIADLNPSILMQKNPIIFDEQIVNPISLLHTAFKYLYVFKRVTETLDPVPKPFFTQNKARYLIVCSKTPNSSVHILNKATAQQTTIDTDKALEPPYVEIKLHENMCMVLPFNWWYRIANPSSISTIALEDILTLTIGRLV